MRWEVQYPEPKKPRPFDNYDLATCLGFAYMYTLSVLNFNIVLFLVAEILWAWFCSKRIQSK